MTISNFERLSGDIVQRDMSLVWWAGITYPQWKKYLVNMQYKQVLFRSIFNHKFVQEIWFVVWIKLLQRVVKKLDSTDRL